MLSVLIWGPVLGAAAIAFWPAELKPQTVRNLAITLGLLLLAWTGAIALQFNPHLSELQLTEVLPWLKALGLTYNLGIDGLSFPLILLNSLLTLIAITSSDLQLQRPRFYYALLFLLNSCVSGAFCAQDYLLFFLFYELELIPLYLLIAIWGGKRRGYAATKFLMYTAVSGIALLASFLGITWLSGAATFTYDPAIAQTLPLATQLICLGGILLAFGIKIPLVPFHTWLPDAHVEASTPISVLLAGVLLKLGTYGLLKFGLLLLPDAWQILAPSLAVWAAISAIYGALSAIAQTDMKKMVAFSSVAHMGYILLAGATATSLSFLAAILQMVSHGLISALLFLLVGVVYKKTGTRDLNILKGLLNPERGLPLIGSLMIVGVMASAGIPGMVGFVSEFLVFWSSFPTFPIPTLICMVGTGLTAVYYLLLVNRTFFGRLSDTVQNLPPVQWSDRIPAIALTLLIVFFGLFPSTLTQWSETTSTALFPTQTLVSQSPIP
ncbi:NADH-quinone oxidoreductase subunit M [Roseofilum capinflatum]|uniref:NADH-quinone oxidoreductase subunit M n=1 Tax=Roseofilum capinflatum BLCC-M114 TaxID=3022440 RepID=A0ABT7B2C5_9CYAN|nr:NADH-quinone oxidoreductase subunit M [Roseofilum capinflatum]MDJ1173289.1 NADH-quinone oxidoreductase subunit M [Roseofilum capinflatum BLCC-M114]